MKNIFLIFAVFLMTAFSVFGQKAMLYHLQKPENAVSIQKQDKQRLLDEDEAEGRKGRLRCAVLLPADIEFPGKIQPETLPEGKIWRLQIDADEAEAINLFLEDFHLSKGSELSFYSPDYERKLQTVSSVENPADKIFVTDHLAGSSVIVELFTPTGADKNSFFFIKEIGYMYRLLPQWLGNSKGFGTSESCEVNINCPEGQDWQQEKHGVARILLLVDSSYYYCSGSLINNTRNDKTPYFLTAYHCGEGASETDFKQWKFYFNYESASCQNPSFAPSYSLATGATKIAEGNQSGSDFLLLKLDALPSDSNLFFNGWNIESAPAANGVGIHHPDGDIKKISTYGTSLQSNGVTHWQVKWMKTQTNWGVTEKGSSGSPLFDQNKLLVGTLTGGYSECSTQTGNDYYGKMSYHWNKNGSLPKNQLKPWLDPDNQGITQLSGILVSDSIPPPPPPAARNYFAWPNPVEDILHVEPEEGYNNQKVTIYNISGMAVLEKKFLNNEDVLEIDLSLLASGFYIVASYSDHKCRRTKIIKI